MPEGWKSRGGPAVGDETTGSISGDSDGAAVDAYSSDDDIATTPPTAGPPRLPRAPLSATNASPMPRAEFVDAGWDGASDGDHDRNHSVFVATLPSPVSASLPSSRMDLQADAVPESTLMKTARLMPQHMPEQHVWRTTTLDDLLTAADVSDIIDEYETNLEQGGGYYANVSSIRGGGGDDGSSMHIHRPRAVRPEHSSAGALEALERVGAGARATAKESSDDALGSSTPHKHAFAPIVMEEGREEGPFKSPATLAEYANTTLVQPIPEVLHGTINAMSMAPHSPGVVKEAPLSTPSAASPATVSRAASPHTSSAQSPGYENSLAQMQLQPIAEVLQHAIIGLDSGSAVDSLGSSDLKAAYLARTANALDAALALAAERDAVYSQKTPPASSPLGHKYEDVGQLCIQAHAARAHVLKQVVETACLKVCVACHGVWASVSALGVESAADLRAITEVDLTAGIAAMPTIKARRLVSIIRSMLATELQDGTVEPKQNKSRDTEDRDSNGAALAVSTEVDGSGAALDSQRDCQQPQSQYPHPPVGGDRNDCVASDNISEQQKVGTTTSTAASMWADANPPPAAVRRDDWTKLVHTLWHFGRGAVKRTDPRFRAFRCALACHQMSELYRGCAFSTAVQGRLLLARALGFLRPPSDRAASPPPSSPLPSNVTERRRGRKGRRKTAAEDARRSATPSPTGRAENCDGRGISPLNSSGNNNGHRRRIHSSEAAAGIKEKILKLVATNVIDKRTAAAMRTLRSFGLRAGRDSDIDPSEKPALAAAAYAVLKSVSAAACHKYPRQWREAEADATVELA